MTAVVDPGAEEVRRQREIALAVWHQTRHTASTHLTNAQRGELTRRLLEKLGFLGDVAADF